jgi:7-keto-8-aminopelargonate synthetase-like enzyme
MDGERHGIGASSAASATTLAIDGRTLLSFAGCNYLGLAHHPRVIAALAEGLERHGISSGASRATTGNSTAHEALERDLARFLGRAAALLTPDGYLANLVVAQGLAPDHDVALVDEKCHASTRDALAASGWTVAEYAHADARSAARSLSEFESRRARARSSAERIRPAIFTDGVFPSLGSIAPLSDLLELLPPEGGALVVDDCHATGVLGERGRGTCEQLGIDDPRLVISTTLSKALGCYGGCIAGTRARIDAARSRSRAFVCASPIPPALALAGSAALRELDSDRELLERLRRNTAHLRRHFSQLGLPVPRLDVPVFAFTLESAERMERLHVELLEHGVLAPFIRYPDGMDDARGYFRITLCAEHTPADIDRLAVELGRGLEHGMEQVIEGGRRA